MKNPVIKNLFKMLSLLLFLIVPSVFAQDVDKSQKESKTAYELTDEQRKAMAERHERMAICLRAGKSFKECRTEMMGSSSQMMWDEECSMMDMMPGRMMKNREYYKEKGSVKKETDTKKK